MRICSLLHLAPNMNRLLGRALSSHEIELRWDEPDPTNGILKPYEVYCVDNKGNSTPPIQTTERLVAISNLRRNTKYICTVKASTYCDEQQDPSACEALVHSVPIRTFDIGKSRCLPMNFLYEWFKRRMVLRESPSIQPFSNKLRKLRDVSVPAWFFNNITKSH